MTYTGYNTGYYTNIIPTNFQDPTYLISAYPPSHPIDHTTDPITASLAHPNTNSQELTYQALANQAISHLTQAYQNLTSPPSVPSQSYSSYNSLSSTEFPGYSSYYPTLASQTQSYSEYTALLTQGDQPNSANQISYSSNYPHSIDGIQGYSTQTPTGYYPILYPTQIFPNQTEEVYSSSTSENVMSSHWIDEEDTQLMDLVEYYGDDDWDTIAPFLDRTPKECEDHWKYVVLPKIPQEEHYKYQSAIPWGDNLLKELMEAEHPWEYIVQEIKKVLDVKISIDACKQYWFMHVLPNIPQEEQHKYAPKPWTQTDSELRKEYELDQEIIGSTLHYSASILDSPPTSSSSASEQTTIKSIRHWSKEEDELLRNLKNKHTSWALITRRFNKTLRSNRTREACRKRWQKISLNIPKEQRQDYPTESYPNYD